MFTDGCRTCLKKHSDKNVGDSKMKVATMGDRAGATATLYILMDGLLDGEEWRHEGSEAKA